MEIKYSDKKLIRPCAQSLRERNIVERLSLYGGLFGLLFYNGSEGQNITTTDQCEESKLALCDCWLGYPIWVGYMCLLDYARNGILRYEDKQESKKIVPNFHHLKPTACLSTAKFKPSQ